MRYAFILGRVYTLSVAELVAVLEKPDAALNLSGEPVKILEASEEVLIIETPNPLSVEKLQKKLGGVIKILEVIDVIKKRENDSINFALKHYFKPSVLKKLFFKDYKGKMQFGIRGESAVELADSGNADVELHAFGCDIDESENGEDPEQKQSGQDNPDKGQEGFG